MTMCWDEWIDKDWSRLGACQSIWELFVSNPTRLLFDATPGSCACDDLVHRVYGEGAAGPARPEDAIYFVALVLFDEVAGPELISGLSSAEANMFLDMLVDLQSDTLPIVRHWACKGLWRALHLYNKCVAGPATILGEARWKAAAARSWLDTGMLHPKSRRSSFRLKVGQTSAASSALALAVAECKDPDSEGGEDFETGTGAALHHKAIDASALEQAFANLAIASLIAVTSKTPDASGIGPSAWVDNADVQALWEILLGQVCKPRVEDLVERRHLGPLSPCTAEAFGTTVRSPHMIAPVLVGVAHLHGAAQERLYYLKNLNLLMLQSAQNLEGLVTTRRWQSLILLILATTKRHGENTEAPVDAEVVSYALNLVSYVMAQSLQRKQERLGKEIFSFATQSMQVARWDARARRIVRKVVLSVLRQMQASAFWRREGEVAWEACFALARFIIAFVFFAPPAAASPTGGERRPRAGSRPQSRARANSGGSKLFRTSSWKSTGRKGTSDGGSVGSRRGSHDAADFDFTGSTETVHYPPFRAEDDDREIDVAAFATAAADAGDRAADDRKEARWFDYRARAAAWSVAALGESAATQWEGLHPVASLDAWAGLDAVYVDDDDDDASNSIPNSASHLDLHSDDNDDDDDDNDSFSSSATGSDDYGPLASVFGQQSPRLLNPSASFHMPRHTPRGSSLSCKLSQRSTTGTKTMSMSRGMYRFESPRSAHTILQRRASSFSNSYAVNVDATVDIIAAGLEIAQTTSASETETMLSLDFSLEDPCKSGALSFRTEAFGIEFDDAGAPLDLAIIQTMHGLFQAMGLRGDSSDDETLRDMLFEKKERANFVRASELCHGFAVLRSALTPRDGSRTAPKSLSETARKSALFIASFCSRDAHHLTKTALAKDIASHLREALCEPAAAQARLDVWKATATHAKPENVKNAKSTPTHGNGGLSRKPSRLGLLRRRMSMFAPSNV